MTCTHPYAYPAQWNDERYFYSEVRTAPPAWGPERVWDRLYTDSEGCPAFETYMCIKGDDGRLGWLVRGPLGYRVLWEDEL